MDRPSRDDRVISAIASAHEEKIEVIRIYRVAEFAALACNGKRWYGFSWIPTLIDPITRLAAESGAP